MKILKNDSITSFQNPQKKPSRLEAEEAVKILLKWAGDNPSREGLIETPERFVKAFEEYFSGYDKDINSILNKTFSEVSDYNDIVLLKNIPFQSHCEHHIAPIIGRSSIAYYPKGKVVGISKLARVLDMFAKRLQTQETLTAQIGNAINTVLKPKGVAVYIYAEHFCMKCRGVHKENVSMITTHFSGNFEKNLSNQQRFLNLIEK
tara:strand:- start:9615 stop:10229 length:615 start_codon:yes stop_codon:yes gene_type:complete